MMIRPEFKTILIDQRGAAVILWSCFVISIPIYIMIARQVLENPNIGANRSFADAARIVVWFLTALDLGYYAYWRKRYMSPESIFRTARSTKLLRALEEFNGTVEERAAYVVSTYSRSSKPLRYTGLSWQLSAASSPICICFPP